MTNEKVDIAIIGGGIAGLTLAKYLAEEGIDFVLFEEDDEFFKKACGEFISIELNGFEFFDLYESKKGIERLIDGAIIKTKYGKINWEISGIICNKLEVEREIANQAEKKGARIVMNSKVEKIKKCKNDLLILPQNIKSKIIVGADGVCSIVRNYMDISKPKCGIAAYGIRKAETSDKNYYEFEKDITPYGYSWFFPKRREWNIGIGTSDPKYFGECFSKFKNRFPNVKKWKSSLIPLSKPLKSYGKNTILVGDSAAQIVACSGSGNFSSMICAKIAADELTKISKNEFKSIDLSSYERAWKDKLLSLFNQGYIGYRLLLKIYFSEYLIHKFLKIACKIWR